MSVTTPAVGGTGRRGLVRKLSTYAAGSVVATACSEATLVVCYGLLHLGAGPAAVIAWVAGALPNYWINRSWTWQRSGRPSLRDEVAPYVAIILGTLLVAVTATHLVSSALQDRSDATRTTVVAITFLGVYVVMFLLRYFMLDRLFGRLGAGSVPSGAAQSGAVPPAQAPTTDKRDR